MRFSLYAVLSFGVLHLLFSFLGKDIAFQNDILTISILQCIIVYTYLKLIILMALDKFFFVQV